MFLKFSVSDLLDEIIHLEFREYDQLTMKKKNVNKKYNYARRRSDQAMTGLQIGKILFLLWQILFVFGHIIFMVYGQIFKE